MSQVSINSTLNPHGSRVKSFKESQYHMTFLFFDNINDQMHRIAELGCASESTNKARYIIDYFSAVKQLFVTTALVLNQDDIKDYFEGFAEIAKYINFNRKVVVNKRYVISSLQEITAQLYVTMQKKQLMLPMKSDESGSSFKAIGNKFGLGK